MICRCCYCKRDAYAPNYIWFSHGKGVLCKECYELYDKEIKLIEEKYKVERGFLIKEDTLND